MPQINSNSDLSCKSLNSVNKSKITPDIVQNSNSVVECSKKSTLKTFVLENTRLVMCAALLTVVAMYFAIRVIKKRRDAAQRQEEEMEESVDDEDGYTGEPQSNSNSTLPLSQARQQQQQQQLHNQALRHQQAIRQHHQQQQFVQAQATAAQRQQQHQPLNNKPTPVNSATPLAVANGTTITLTDKDLQQGVPVGDKNEAEQLPPAVTPNS